jgi:hypothetical protein
MPTTMLQRKPTTEFPDDYRQDEDYRAAMRFDIQSGSSELVAWNVKTPAVGEFQYEELRDEGLDLEKTKQDLEQFAAVSGINLAELTSAAGAHFREDRLAPRATGLTSKELSDLAEDDDHHARNLP